MQSRLDRAAGLTKASYVSGYRGSPLGSFDMSPTRAAKNLAAASTLFQPGLNKDLAATAIRGTQQAALYEKPRLHGVFGVWYGKGPGVDRSGDALKHGNLAGTHRNGGVVVLAGDDHVCKWSTTAHQSGQALGAAGIPVLNPSGVEDIVSFFLTAIGMSRYSGCWVSLKCAIVVVTFPTDLDLASIVGRCPYLAALVASSWRAMPRC